ncbi:polysaccharide deacetylase family protein [Roseateles sp.]|uniref:polysaccharide deacetylase family protein n=1 Tax=Roseateles sp. TaxID=1971397 RepID=UPI0039E93A10
MPILQVLPNVILTRIVFMPPFEMRFAQLLVSALASSSLWLKNCATDCRRRHMMRREWPRLGLQTIPLIRRLGLVCVVAIAPSVSSAEGDVKPGRKVAITFDDLPYAGAIGQGEGALPPNEVVALNTRIQKVLKRYAAPAIGFVVEQSAEKMGAQSRPLLKLWTVDDFTLGNHSYSHADTNKIDLASIEDEIVRGEVSIRPLMYDAGRPLRFMRFPMNHTGDSVAKRSGIQAILERLGYISAASTIDTSDYVFERAYGVALVRKDGHCAERIRRGYIEYSSMQIDYYTKLSQEVLGYAPPEIALLHLNRINADSMEDILKLYVDRGFQFVSLEEAQKDQAYLGELGFISRFGPMWGYRWARERGIKVNGKLEPEPPQWLSDYVANEVGRCQ